ncbi:TonB-dependent receptor [Aerophototrophica crusticola]|uniref:TonB-dependent receptor n=1 Tax=Aerophototrophica crusticola TaxID=1709002 RepID=A0A858RB23_9PROT|nr:TonB-dependent receptor [Rhodospirillaceae bacterium B3]
MRTPPPSPAAAGIRQPVRGRGLLLLGTALVAALPVASPAGAQTTAGSQRTEEVVVIGRRSGVPAYERAYGPTVLGPEFLDTAPERRLDEALRAVPGFSLFRRSGSRTANPTTQGVSLRGLGPNGAGRTLVLVDGVPVNDPFGGWVYWARLPTASTERVVITRGGGAGPWGNAALAGTIRIETRATDGLYGEVAGGSDGTFQGLGSVGGKAGPFRLGLTASAFQTDGVPLVRKDRRGPIDIDADAEAYNIDGTASLELGTVTATAKLSGFREHRGNGTPYTENATEALEGSLRLVGQGAVSWEAVVYARDWTFDSTFSGVNATRTGETPSLDQYEVPATAYGAVFQVGFKPFPDHETDVGADIRLTDGETREFFTFTNGAYRRDRAAGGEQEVAGLFVEHAWTPAPTLTVTGGLRFDWWENDDGIRREVNLDNGAVVRNDRFETKSGRVLNGRAGVDWQATEQVGLRAAFYTGFRLPTLNELYRPFRVGNDITEANPNLGPERLTGGEAGVRFSPVPGLELSATYFHARLENAVDNVVLQETPGLNAATGVFVPAGGSLAQRRGLDRVVANGIEAELDWAARDDLRFRLSYLYSDSEIERAQGFAALEGNRLGQAPKHQGTAEAEWQPLDPLVLRLQVRAVGESFEDSRNTRTLAPYVTGDAYVGYDITDAVHLFATVENLTDRTIETGKRTDGLVNIGPGRQWLLGAKARF